MLFDVRRVLIVLVLGVLSALTLLLVAGHGPWAGREIWRLDATHGLNSGDLPVLAMWAFGSLCCLVLLWREP
jgi:hypothetical protein